MFKGAFIFLLFTIVIVHVSFAEVSLKILYEPQSDIEISEEGLSGPYVERKTHTLVVDGGVGIGVEYSRDIWQSFFLGVGFDYFLERNISSIKINHTIGEYEVADLAETVDDAKYQISYPYFRVGYSIDAGRGSLGLFYRFSHLEFSGGDMQYISSDPSIEPCIGLFGEYTYQEAIKVALFIGKNSYIWDSSDFPDMTYSSQTVVTLSGSYLLGGGFGSGSVIRSSRRSSSGRSYYGL